MKSTAKIIGVTLALTVFLINIIFNDYKGFERDVTISLNIIALYVQFLFWRFI